MCVAIKKTGRIGIPDKRVTPDSAANVRQNIRYDRPAHVSHIFGLLFVPGINNPRIHGPIISLTA